MGLESFQPYWSLLFNFGAGGGDREQREHGGEGRHSERLLEVSRHVPLGTPRHPQQARLAPTPAEPTHSPPILRPSALGRSGAAKTRTRPSSAGRMGARNSRLARSPTDTQ